MKWAPVRSASARLRFHCEMSRALSNEMMTTCLGFAGLGGAGGSAKATPAVASEAKENATARNERYIGNLILTRRMSGSRLSRKCGAGTIGLLGGRPWE